MKSFRFVLALLGFFSFVLTCTTAQGYILESQTYFSHSLNQESKYSIYLPENIDKKEGIFPIIYLLHGFSGNETDWVRNGEIAFKANTAVLEGRLPSCIIVMPDGKNSWYINSPIYGNYEDMLIKDLIPLIEKKYGTPLKNDRAIIGLSMGGYAAFSLAMKYPDIFGSSVALSGSFWSDGYYYNYRENDVPYLFNAVYGDDPISTDLWKQNNPFNFLNHANINQYNSVRILFDCGDDDIGTFSQLELSNLLRQKNIKHELRIRDGQHNWDYWKETIVDALEFCANGFNR